MILEGIVTTVSPTGDLHVAPMGPRVDANMKRFILRPFFTSQTYRNLLVHGEGVLHITDDVLLLARAALGQIEPPPSAIPATKVRGYVLKDACRFYEFTVRGIDDREERVRIEAEIVHQGTLREFFGFNRAKHAVVEAAILATRTDFIPLAQIEAEYDKWAVIIDKTGGSQEHEAFAFLRNHIEQIKKHQPAASGGRS
jgi:uncharacterized protein